MLELASSRPSGLKATASQAFPLSSGTGDDRRPAWSPDGEWIAFQSTRGGRRHVYLIPADGGEARRLGRDDAQEESWPAWFPDSRTLMVQMGPAGGMTRLWLFHTDPESRPRLLSIPPTPGRPQQLGAPPPSLSRDGARLVMAGGGEAAIEVLPAAGGGPTTVLSGSGRVRQPTWAKDGRRIVVAGDLGGSWDLWMVGTSSGRTTRLTDDDDREMDPAWSRTTGDILFALESPGGSVLQLFEPETRRAIRVGSNAPGARESEPAWSPDARSMAYVSERDGNRDIWVGPIGGGEPRRLTSLPGSETHPTWSPDGQWIAYASDQGSGGTIWKVPVAGGEPIRLTSPKEGFTGDTQPNWSPSDRWIAFTRGLASGGSDVYIITPEGKDLFPIRRGAGARIADPAWSPTGDRLAYSFSRPDEILVLELGVPKPPIPPVPGHKGTPQGMPKTKPPAPGGQRPPVQKNPGQEGPQGEEPEQPEDGLRSR
jgi:Tol biopolymer transport system component